MNRMPINPSAAPSDFNPGQRVTYHGAAGETEFGVVTSINHRYVFVRYGSNTQAQATCPKDLTHG